MLILILPADWEYSRQVPDWDKRDIAGMSTEAHATSRAKLLAQLMYSQVPVTILDVKVMLALTGIELPDSALDTSLRSSAKRPGPGEKMAPESAESRARVGSRVN